MFTPEKVNLDVKDLKYEFINGKLLKRKSFDANGHDFVEIAGIKWATMNVGANKVTDYGLYFQWGDTQGYTKKEIEEEHKKKFASDLSDYKWYDKENSTSDTPLFTKYNGTDGYTELALEDDAVHANWGGSWRMPTKEEFDKFCDAVNTKWKTNYQGSGVNGLLCTANDGSNKTLFLPACGLAEDGRVYRVGGNGGYWLSSLGNRSVSRACALRLGGDSVIVGYDYRSGGHCVRGVLAEN